jgi:hypothetical protein
MKFSIEFMPLKATLTSQFVTRGLHQSDIVHVHTSEVGSKLTPVSVGPCIFMLIGTRRMNNFYENFFLNQKYERGGPLNVKIHVLSYGGNS